MSSRTPSKHISLAKLESLEADHYLGASKEYSEEETKELIHRKRQRAADRITAKRVRDWSGLMDGNSCNSPSKKARLKPKAIPTPPKFKPSIFSLINAELVRY
jgi:hypothetical protein